MSSYYTGRRARHYNTRWHTFTERTQAQVLAMIDFSALHDVPEQLGRLPRVLDVACGTGLLLSKVLELLPNAEAYGVDASADMLAQAYIVLKGQLHVRLEQVAACEGHDEEVKTTEETEPVAIQEEPVEH